MQFKVLINKYMQLCECDKLIQEIPDGKMEMGEVGRDVLVSV